MNSAEIKRRSKSASAGGGARNSVTFSDTVTVQESRPHYPSVTNDRHHHQHHTPASSSAGGTTHDTNSTPNKFTLHSASLPKPQQPIPVKVVPSRSPINTKGLKQQMNLSRRQFFGLTDASPERSPHVSRNRTRNLEMVFNERHKFQVRDLENLATEPVVNLNLPKLPSVFSANNYQPAPLSGLTRQTVNESSSSSADSGINDLNRTVSLGVDGAETVTGVGPTGVGVATKKSSTEEEKHSKDSCNSEKSMKVGKSINTQSIFIIFKFTSRCIGVFFSSDLHNQI